jgi:molybdopterin/thiamine biosynthesis adenylyltransferase
MAQALTETQIHRYSRQIILHEVGAKGQRLLLGTRVALIGSGELPSVTALYLAAAGVGRLDLYHVGPEGAAAAARLCEEIRALNPDVRWTSSSGRGVDEAEITRCDAVVAATDDEALLRAATARAVVGRRPLIAGGVAGARGWLAVVAAAVTKESCALCPAVANREAKAERPGDPFEPIAAGVIGSRQAVEAVRLLLGIGPPPAVETWLHFDAEASTFEERVFRHRQDCPLAAPATAGTPS